MEPEYLLFETDKGIATATFNRPEALNALNTKLLDEFTRLIATIADDESIRVLILTGAGDRAFVAGADIRELSRFNPLEGTLFGRKGQQAVSGLQNLSIPVIAAVNGFALGGGMEIALACDFIYAAETAKFGLPEITLGLIPGFGGTQRLGRLIGPNRAKELIFTGKMIPAPEAAEMGVVNAVFPTDTLLAETRKTAETIAKMGKFSLSAAKRTINDGLNADLETGLSLEASAFGLCMASVDAKEGTTAFLEKRKPDFTGKRTE
jgi:enoyl-CoA hydratase